MDKGRNFTMASKIWKKLLFVILIIACLFNITKKLVQRNSFKAELQSSAQYIQDMAQSKENEEIENSDITENSNDIVIQNQIYIQN